MTQRIDDTFARLRASGRKALIPFITAGDPHPGHTVPLMHALVAGGADIIELGVPFSDPMADGPVIQRASERALLHNLSLLGVLDMVRQFRRDNTTTPVVLMGYMNPVEAVGYAAFAEQAHAAGVDGLLTVDCPPEEAEPLALAMHKVGLAPIFLLAPTTPESRIAAVGRWARGYVYYVSLRGVTGAGHLDTTEVAAKIPQIRRFIDVPVGVGFGIRDGVTARQVADVADAVVIGSRIVQIIEADPVNPAPAVQAFIHEIRQALDA
jgi:tryptophan synthase alpha chain